MPVFRSGIGLAQALSTLEFFELVDLRVGQTREFPRVGIRGKLIILGGVCVLEDGHDQVTADVDHKQSIETLSPTVNPSTSSPTSLITPHTSCPCARVWD